MSYLTQLKTLSLATLFATVFAAEAGAGYTDLYVIGDSLSDQGNLFNATQQATGNGIPANDHYYEGRFSNGAIYADYLALRLGLPLTASSEGGNNFAYGGARTEYNVVEADSVKPFPVSLLAQGGAFPEDAYPWTINTQRDAFAARAVNNPDGLYIVFTGSNDMADLIVMTAVRAANPNFPAVDRGVYISKVLADIDAAIAAAVAAGARDVIVPNLPNFGLVPRIMRGGPAFSALARDISQQYNAAFETMIANWNGRVNIIPFDVYGLLTEIVAQPTAYGFTNATHACYSGFVDPAGPTATVCATPATYVFWDSEHPTTAFHAFAAERMLATAVFDIIADLKARLSAASLPTGVRNSLLKKLDAARQKLNGAKSTHDGAVSAKLNAFVLEVQAQARAGGLSEAEALMLVERIDKLVFLAKAWR